MNLIRAKGIPIWVSILTLLVGVMGTFLGVSALFDPSSAREYIEGANALGIGWAGRNAGLGVALVVAVLLRNASAYAAALAGSLFRELSDIINALPSAGTAIGLSVFLLLEMVLLAISLRAALKNSHE